LPICIAQQGSNEAHREHTIKNRQTTKFNKQSQITNQSIILITSNKISTKTKYLFLFLKEGSVRRKLSQQLCGTSSNKLFFFPFKPCLKTTSHQGFLCGEFSPLGDKKKGWRIQQSDF